MATVIALAKKLNTDFQSLENDTNAINLLISGNNSWRVL